MSGQGHVTTGQVRSSQVLLRSVRTGQVKSRSGEVRPDLVTLMTWSHEGHIRSGQVNVRSRSSQGRVRSGHVKVRSCQVISGSGQLK